MDIHIVIFISLVLLLLAAMVGLIIHALDVTYEKDEEELDDERFEKFMKSDKTSADVEEFLIANKLK